MAFKITYRPQYDPVTKSVSAGTQTILAKHAMISDRFFVFSNASPTEPPIASLVAYISASDVLSIEAINE